MAEFINEPPGIAFDYQVNPSFGGPIMRDKLWFYTTYKYQDAKNYVTQTSDSEPKPFRRLYGNYSAVGRFTWQATSRDKIRFYLERQLNGEYNNGFATYVNISSAAATDAQGNGWVPQVKWSQTTTNRLLLEAGISYYDQAYYQGPNDLVGPLDVARLELTTFRVTGAPGFVTPSYGSWTGDYNAVASATYVTGSHAIKAGTTMLWGENKRTSTQAFGIRELRFFNNNPFQVTVTNFPTYATQQVNSDLGLYVQDSWTVDRLTLNLGVRYDHFSAEVPAQSAPAGPFIVARDFPLIENVPNWNDWATRTAVSYDLFGNGRTALKFNAGKYLASQAAGYAANFNGMTASTQNRTWNDANGDRTVINPDGSIQFNEIIGGTSNFGQITDRPDPDLARGYNWEYSASVDHEVIPRVRVSAGYYRRQFYNLTIDDNVNVNPDDWEPLTITVPNDPRLPTAGQTITLFSLRQDKVGTATDTLRTYSRGLYGTKNTRTYDGFR